MLANGKQPMNFEQTVKNIDSVLCTGTDSELD